MPEPSNDDQHISRKVVVEQVSTGSSRQNIGVIIAIVAIALALLAYILMHMR